MKKNSLLLAGLCLCGMVFAQKIKQKNPEEEIRKYWFVMLLKRTQQEPGFNNDCCNTN